MKHYLTAFLLSFVSFTTLFILMAVILKYLGIGITGWIVVVIACITFVAGPRFSVVKLQSGDKVIVKWIFSKRTWQL